MKNIMPHCGDIYHKIFNKILKNIKNEEILLFGENKCFLNTILTFFGYG
jgi:hypothetical protein